MAKGSRTSAEPEFEKQLRYAVFGLFLHALLSRVSGSVMCPHQRLVYEMKFAFERNVGVWLETVNFLIKRVGVLAKYVQIPLEMGGCPSWSSDRTRRREQGFFQCRIH